MDRLVYSYQVSSESPMVVTAKACRVFRDCNIIYFTGLDAPGGVTPAIANG
jgi:hypothetical protein